MAAKGDQNRWEVYIDCNKFTYFHMDLLVLLSQINEGLGCI